MKKKKRNFDARFWSGKKKHSARELLEAFFQFNDLTMVKQELNTMVQCSVQKKARITDHPADVFHLHQSLRSLIRVGYLIGKNSKKPVAYPPLEAGSPKPFIHSLSAEEYRHPALVFRKAFKARSREDLEYFLSTVTYFSLGNLRCEEEKKIIIPYIHLMKMLDAAWLIVSRTSGGELLTHKTH
ncbi:hypothetical protein [uncultured Chryseobacterium sp.]|uniref:hypothetical protein n=1 Tax=uncultured Chryseobacterium sp. TaxID=259322 RepID=UPI0025D3C874|nr:hypothetical protein [uncultured Chryseobacterium sp.]